MEKYQSVRRLNEVDILRPLAIFLVMLPKTVGDVE